MLKKWLIILLLCVSSIALLFSVLAIGFAIEERQLRKPDEPNTHDLYAMPAVNISSNRPRVESTPGYLERCGILHKAFIKKNTPTAIFFRDLDNDKRIASLFMIIGDSSIADFDVLANELHNTMRDFVIGEDIHLFKLIEIYISTGHKILFEKKYIIQEHTLPNTID